MKHFQNEVEFDEYLKSLANPSARDFTMKTTPGITNVLGISVPKLREISKGILKEDWETFLTWPSISFEHTLVRAIVIGNAKIPVKDKIAYTEKFLPEINSWGINDILCSSFKLGKNDDRDLLWDYCVDLVNRHEEFPSRLGAVLMLTHFIDEDHVEKICDILVECPRCGYYLDMGVAWTLSICFVKFPEITEKYLFDGRLETEVLKMTVRKIRDSFRVEKSEKERLKNRLKEER